MHLVIAGGGFAGFWAAAAAARVGEGKLQIALISRDDVLTIRPRLYEAEAEKMAVPIRERLESIGVQFHQAEIAGITSDAIHLNGEPIPYDRLVLATGSQITRPAGLPGFDIDIRENAAALERHLRTLKPPSTILIVGGGFTGIELATELPSWLPGPLRIILVDRGERIGASLGEGPREAIEAALRKAGVETRTQTTVDSADNRSVTLSTGEHIACDALVWTTGMRASSLASQISTETDSLGRIRVTPELRVIGKPHMFAAGDVAHAITDDSHPALQSCQHAQSMGKFAGHNAAADLLGLPLIPYSQPLYTTCLDLGQYGAVLTKGWDRQVQLEGPGAKAVKRMINTQLIYPPSDPELILAAAAPSIFDEETFNKRFLAAAR